MFTYATSVNGHLFLVYADNIEGALSKVHSRMSKEGFTQPEINAASIKISDAHLDEVKSLR